MRARFLFASILCVAGHAFGHEGDHDSYADRSKAVTTTRGEKRIVDANGLPDHQPGQFPNRGNPNSISAQHYHFEMPLHPRAASRPTPIRGFLFGVAINGVVFDPGTAEVWRPGARIVSRPGPDTRFDPRHDPSLVWNYEGMGRMNLGIDDSHAHVQPTGAYHYHGLPTGLINRLRAEQSRDEMLLIGYAADGFPIYAEYGQASADDASSPLVKLKPSYRMKQGQRPAGKSGPGGKYDGTFVQDYEFVEGSGDLDQCNGRTGVTPEYPDSTYYYVVSNSFPFVPRFFHGQPDPSFEKQHPPGPDGRRGLSAFPGKRPRPRY